MGSQRVTNFSQAKKNRIQAVIRAFDPQSKQADQMAMSAAATTIGPFTRTNSFVQSLASPSIEEGLRLLLSLAESARETKTAVESQEILAAYGVSPQNRRPYAALAASLTQSLSETLTSTQQNTESAIAANDSLSQTVLDLLGENRGGEAAEASPEEVTDAFRRIPPVDLAKRFIDNAIDSLIGQSLDAVREEDSPEKVAALKEEIRKEFTPKLGNLLVPADTRGKLKPTAIAAQVTKPSTLKKLERWRTVPAQFIPVPPQPPVPQNKPKKK